MTFRKMKNQKFELLIFWKFDWKISIFFFIEKTGIYRKNPLGENSLIRLEMPLEIIPKNIGNLG